MRWLLSAILCLLLVGACYAQSTTVSSTVVDAASTTWKNGTFSLTFRVSASNPTGQYYWAGVPFNVSQTISGNLDNTGSFSVSVPSNTSITPAGSTWTYAVCPAASSPCYSTNVTITGATQSLSGITPPAASVSLSNPPAGVSAYNDAEITGAKTGSYYWNLTDSTLHTCSGFPPCTWLSIGSTSSILPSNNTFTGNNTFSLLTTFNGGLTSAGPNTLNGTTNAGVAGNVGIKPATSDAHLFVSINGNDSNDGFSWGTAKLTIGAAYTALPSCSNAHYYTGSYSSLTWTHCGKIEIGAGTFTLASLVTISSPFVTIEGRSPISTILNVTGATGGILWTSSPLVNEYSGVGGLYRVTIDGFGSSAGAYGLQTNDISAFHMHDVVIKNFTGAGSIGWLDSATNWYNEKFVVDVTLDNNTINWEINPGAASPGYPQTTFGYGVFDVKMIDWSGQTGLLMVNGALQESVIHITVNQGSTPANASAIVLQNSASYSNNVSEIHIESPGGIGTGAEINIGASAAFNSIGELDQTLSASNVLSGGFQPLYLGNYTWNSSTGNSFGPIGTTVQNVAKSSGWVYGTNFVANYTGSGANTGNFFGAYAAATQNGSGTVANLSGVAGQTSAANATGNVANTSAIHALAPSITGSGSIGNAKGVYIEPQKVTGVTNGYGIYQAGSSDLNLLLGTTSLAAITNATGFQVFNTTTTCTTAATAGATCTTAAISLPVAEADTSYRVTCTGKGPTNVPVVGWTTNSSASQFTITIVAITAAAATFTSYDCVAGHN
jgi:hypothetical protein